MQNEETTLTAKIKRFSGGVVSNPYQGTDKKVLFVCSIGILRSATGARMYAKKYNTRCAGTNSMALIPLTQLLIDWADLVVFVNRENYNTACANFNQQEFDYKCKVLGIPDQYPHMHPLLIKQFKKQFESTNKVRESV
jgi:predicted protein tyrosine phosphatase